MNAPTAEELTTSIRGAGLKVTEPRLAVLKALGEKPHSDADTVYGAVKQELPGTSLQAVYGVLAALTASGLLRKIEPAGSSARYERRIGDNHHHLVCTQCSAIQDVDCAVGEAPCLTPSDSAGFAVHTAEVTYWGLCSTCQQTQTSTN
jgi:Fe2+ or Zn2+ uptake regulation protein